MEEGNLRGDIPLPDQKKKSNSELIRTSSESSGLTVDNANAIPVTLLALNLLLSLETNLRIT
jgi:hypothetical protein